MKATVYDPRGDTLIASSGAASVNQPAGAPAGESRKYSAVSAYSIDPVSRTAQERWRFDYGQTIYSDICSRADEGPKKRQSWSATLQQRTARRPDWWALMRIALSCSI